MRSDKTFRYEFRDDGSITMHGQLAHAHLHALHQARVDLKGHANRILDAASTTNRKLTATETTGFSSCAHELEVIEQAILLAEREQDLERRAATSGDVAIVTPKTGRRFAQMFPHIALTPTPAGFKSSNEFLAVLHSGMADERLQAIFSPAQLLATATGDVDSSGGFSVPPQMFSQWLDSSLASEIVRSRADVRPMLSNTAWAPGWDNNDHTASLYGGFTAQWIGEAGAITAQTPKMRLIKLLAKKLAILAAVSNELLSDGIGYDQQLGEAMTGALGFFLDTAFLLGPGAPGPLGVVNAPCTITVSKEVGQTTTRLFFENFKKMFARLTPASISNAVWVCNSTTIPELLSLYQSVGVGGIPVPVMSESNGEFRILTRPVIFTEKVAALGTKGDVGLYDFSQYVVGMRAEFLLAKSMHAGFATDTTYYRGTIRVDGQPKLSAPITPANGDTLSPFVVLESR